MAKNTKTTTTTPSTAPPRVTTPTTTTGFTPTPPTRTPPPQTTPPQTRPTQTTPPTPFGTTTKARSTGDTTIPYDRIAQCAYDIYTDRVRYGRPGTPEGDWTEAERRLRQRT